jgi:outer membrane protein assembly factor BamD
MFRKIIPAIILLGLLATSCSKYQRLLKSTDYEEKYQMAFVYYERGDYYRAIQLFDQVIPFFRGTERAETIAWNYAYAHYRQKDYMLASFYFKSFVNNFPRSKHTEEATFLSAYCKFLDSPHYTLDQTSTREAINELQMFINKFPNSERVVESNRLIDELRLKLERKAMSIARLYYRMNRYNAAITSLGNILKDFPDTEFREEILWLKLKSHYDFASNSIEARQGERFEQALEAFDNLMAQFPGGTYAREATQIQRNILNQLQSASN